MLRAILFGCGEEMSLDDGTRVCDVIRLTGPGSSVLQVEDSVVRRINDHQHVLQRGCVYRTFIERKEKAQNVHSASTTCKSTAAQKTRNVEKWNTRGSTNPEVTTFPRGSCDLAMVTNNSLPLPTVSKAGLVETVPEGTTVADVLRTVQREDAPYLVLLFPSGEAASIFKPSYALERGCQYELRYRTSRQTSVVKQFDQYGSSSGSPPVNRAGRVVAVRGASVDPLFSHHNLSTITKRTNKQHSGTKAATALIQDSTARNRLPRITPTTSRSIKSTKVSSIASTKISPTTSAKARNNTQVPTTVSGTTSIKAGASGTPVLPEVTPKQIPGTKRA